jgi:hypothetical protein
MERIMGLFESYEGADRAAEALEFEGFPEEISVVSRDKAVRERVERVEWIDWVNNVVGAATVGAVGGMVVGGLAGFFIGLTVTLIWGSGPDLAAWALSTALGAAAAGVGIGMVTGSVAGALIGRGLPLGVYTQGVRRGGILVTVRAPDSYAADSARDIMCDSGAVDINEWTNEPSAASRGIGFRENVWPTGHVPSTLMHTHSHS